MTHATYYTLLEATARIAHNLYAFRVRKQLTQSELAALSGVHRNTINRLELGRQKNPTLGTLLLLAEGLGITLWELLA